MITVKLDLLDGKGPVDVAVSDHAAADRLRMFTTDADNAFADRDRWIKVRMERLDGDIDEVVSADFARTLERELIEARSETAAPDRPDWAQQLPGAEMFDRIETGAARYEYLRTLNSRKFAALYNEALMGVHQFDDLVDRYRDASQPSPTTREQSK